MPLQIGNKKIDRISGPVSMYILKPTEYIFNKYKKFGVNAPVFMLFGDYHNSNKFMCDKCTCKKGDSKCCHKIYDPDFLIWVDTIAEGRFEDTNRVFASPERYDVRVTEQDANKWAKIIYEKISHKI
jgi:hypothetical protein